MTRTHRVSSYERRSPSKPSVQIAMTERLRSEVDGARVEAAVAERAADMVANPHEYGVE